MTGNYLTRANITGIQELKQKNM